MADIFLSYNREDQAVADLFVRGFEAAGLSVWWDVALRAGEAYDEVTENALRTAKAVVVLWSTRSVASRWVRAEATMAQSLGTFFPCMIEPCNRPIMFELTQTPDLSHWNGQENDPSWTRFIAHARDFVGNSPNAKTEPADAGQAAAAATPAKSTAPSSERRHITSLSAAIAGGDRLASSLDPEDWHEVISELQAKLTPVAQELGGAAKWNGHNFAVTFGFPVAMEDAALRAINCALALTNITKEQASEMAQLTGSPVELKIGIHCARALVTQTSGEAEVFGDLTTVSEAARDAAQPNSIYVSSSIRDLASGAFDLESVGSGSENAEYWDVKGKSQNSGATRGWETGELTSFVGRDDELAHLRRRWARTLDQEGQFVLVRGEPGIGKSRLVEQFRSRIEDDEPVWFTFQGSSLFPNTPYYALAQSLGQLLEDEEGEPLAVLNRRLADLGFPAELGPMLAPIIGIETPEDATAQVSQDAKRAQLISALANAIFSLSEQKPVVLYIDDLQWIDPSTMEMVQLLIEQGEQERLLILGTARPEFHPPWAESDHHSRINLARLAKSEVKALIVEAAGSENIDHEVLDSILDKADGVPLFAEELAKLAAKHDSTDGQTLPPTLQSLLAARMDRMGEAREVLQVCSVLGAASYAVLAAMMGVHSEALDTQLRQLVEEQLLHVRGAPPHSNYRFKHALLRDAAYETLTRKRQRQLHSEAAHTIINKFPEMAEAQQELVASHWSNANENERAVAAWLQAGNREFIRGASRESSAHLKQGLSLIDKLPEGEERDQLEMELWSSLNNALQQSLGYSNPETMEAADKARELARSLGMLAKVILGEAQLWRASVNAGKYEEADQIALRIAELTEELDESERPPWMPYFHANASLQTAYYNGRLHEFEAPYSELEKRFGNHQGMITINDDVVAIGVASLAAWTAGRSSLSRERAKKAVDVAEGSGQPYAIAVAHHFAGTLMAFDRDIPTAITHTERALEVCEKNGIEFIGHLVRAKIGWLANADAPAAEDVASMRQILDAMVAANGRVGLVINMNRLAMALEARGELDEAYQAIEEALVANPQERIVRPETYVIKGRIECKLGRENEAEADFLKAIDLAQDIGAGAFGMMASVELAKLKSDQGASDAALSVLKEAISRSGPDIDTPALGDARELQKELEAQAA